MNLAGYIRVSTEGQVDAYGKAVQRKHISDWAEMNAHTITAWFEEDGVSGKTDDADRPALHSLLTGEGYEGLVTFDATRLARRLYIQETLLALIWAAGLRVFTTTAGEIEADEEDPTRILIRQVIGAVAEFEHRSLVRKLASARRIKGGQGGYIGGTPRFGQAVTGSGKYAQLVEDAVESDVIQMIRRFKSQGMSLHGIADRLNLLSIPTKTGKTWYASQVTRILKRSYAAQQG